MRKFSHLLTTKIIVFMIMIACFAGAMQALAGLVAMDNGDIELIFDDNYYHSKSYVMESDQLMSNLTRLLIEYKSEENILKGGSIDKDELSNEEQELFWEYQNHSKNYNPNLSEAENKAKFEVEKADQINEIKNKLIQRDLREFQLLVQNVEQVKEPMYFASDGVNVYTNSSLKEREKFKYYPSYMLFEGYKHEVYPKEIEDNKYLNWITANTDNLGQGNYVVYMAFTKEFLTSNINDWKENKATATNRFYILLGFLAGFFLSFFYLMLVIGRKSFHDKEMQLHSVDKLYVDLNILLCIGLIAPWVAMMEFVGAPNITNWVIPITIPFSIIWFVLILSLVRHVKNKTLFRHSLIFQILSFLVRFVRDTYESGGVGIKTVLIVIGYPLLVAASFFFFPITIGVAAWFALKKVKSFKAIKDGVERIKNGEIQHHIDIAGEGEFARLAADINSITDGLKHAVDNELKSERLKTELITNVSHDIRTPLTSIITYVDLLKNEKDHAKINEYVEVLDQKSKRLKVLTDDLFEAAKASSGNIPVELERIDLASLITQGLGEVSDKIEELDLEFRFNQPKEKTFVMADGKLLWRSIENVLSNIFKYALRGSRVYIDIEDLGSQILLSFKNMSAYELNISADELMERFKRGDESRTSHGSGLGLSIAKGLIEAQKGNFIIQIDGDLFKSMIYMPK